MRDPAQHPYRIQSGYFPSYQVRGASHGYPVPHESGPMLFQGRTASPSPALRATGPSPALRATGPSPALRSTGPTPAHRRAAERAPERPPQRPPQRAPERPPQRAPDWAPQRAPDWAPDRDRRRTWPQLAGGLLIAAACAGSALWYVPRVMADDRQVITGTVSSSGVVALNFTAAGQISKVNVHLDQAVHKGEVLAVEYAPNADSIVAADKAAISAEQAKIAQLRAAAAADPANASVDSTEIAAARAQLASDQAQLATDRLKITATEIIAPAAGTVVAANGQPGETVTASGLRSYTSDSQQEATMQGPQFSLLPEGPQPVRRSAAPGSSLPVIAVRVSTAWQVVALVPEASVAVIKAGRRVTITVPTARIAGVTGQVEQVISTPVSTPEGLYYQAVITVTGRAAAAPMNGMAADIKLG